MFSKLLLHCIVCLYCVTLCTRMTCGFVYLTRRHGSTYREELFDCEFQSRTSPVTALSTCPTPQAAPSPLPSAVECSEPLADGECEDLSQCELLDEWLADADTQDVPPALRALAAGPASDSPMSRQSRVPSRTVSHASQQKTPAQPPPQNQTSTASVTSAPPPRRTRKPYRVSTQPLPDYIPL